VFVGAGKVEKQRHLNTARPARCPGGPPFTQVIVILVCAKPTTSPVIQCRNRIVTG
jgi:hypothetical protein